MRVFILFIFITVPMFLWAQRGTISGMVTDKNTQKPVEGASIVFVNNSNTGTKTDSTGKFRLVNIPTGSYQIKISCVGFVDENLYNVIITSGNENTLAISLIPAEAQALKEVKISGSKSARVATLSTPLSVQRLTSEEIKSNPGGNFDISRVIQTLPGVSGTDGSSGGFRNDIIIRGGSPNENVFYLDGIEVPVINHFSTQGSGGGPAGILNVSFIQDVKLSTSAFDARYDNALSSVFQFTQKEGNPNHYQGNIRLSASEIAGTVEGPIDDKTTFLASIRRSYLQLLFSLIDLPIRPNYWDFQTKITHKFNKNTTLNFIGIGAIDEFSFGTIKNATPEKLYTLANTPNINQNNYTVGLSLRHSLNHGFFNMALSRNVLNNKIDKYDDNQSNDPSKLRLNINSQEAENKLRIDFNFFNHGWSWAYGASAQYEQFTNNYFQRFRAQLTDNNGNIIQPAIVFNSNTGLDFFKFGAFGQVGKRLFNNKLGLNFGLRTDQNTFTTDGLNPANSLSPRFSVSYALSNEWNLNASVGTYYKTPVYTVLGYTDQNGIYVNKGNKLTRADHYVAGLEYIPRPSTRFTLEVFDKYYSNYPVSVRDGISLANEGGDFTTLGNEAIASIGKGHAYGIEFFAQQKLTDRFFGVLSYTLFNSTFSGVNGKQVPSAWDNQQLVSFTFGYKLPRNYEFGLKFRYQGGAPYTPFDANASRANYLTTGAGVLDYSQLNTLRLSAFNASDLRIDKKWNFKKRTLDLYLDVTNWYNAKQPAYPEYTFERNATNTAFVTTDNKTIQQNGANAIPFLLNNDSGSILPTIGFIYEF